MPGEAFKPRVVLDASALLAYLQRERGYEAVEPVLENSALSAVNVDGRRLDQIVQAAGGK